MVTVMEQTHAINQSKKGILPEKFEKEHPHLSSIVKKMLSKDPTERPLLKVLFKKIIHTHLSLLYKGNRS